MRFIESQKEVIDTLRQPSKHSSTERKRAYLFLFVYILGFIAFCGSFFHFISGWIACAAVEVVQLIFVLIYAFNINDYSERTMGAMECERACNPLVDGYIAVRVLQIIQAFFLGSYLTMVVFMLCLGFLIWRVSKGNMYVDATNLWREIKKFERESYYCIVVEVSLIIFIIIVMVFSIINRYS